MFLSQPEVSMQAWIGLLFLYAAQAEQFKEADEPEWVTSWLSKREEKPKKGTESQKRHACR